MLILYLIVVVRSSESTPQVVSSRVLSQKPVHRRCQALPALLVVDRMISINDILIPIEVWINHVIVIISLE